MSLARPTNYYYHCWRCGGPVLAYEGRLCGYFRRSCPVCWPSTDGDGGPGMLDPHGPGPGDSYDDNDTWTLRQWPRKALTDDDDCDDYILISGSGDEDYDAADDITEDVAAAR